MSRIARRLTGITEKELREYNFPSAKPGNIFFGTTHRNIKISAGLILTPEDLEQERLRSIIPECLC